MNLIDAIEAEPPAHKGPTCGIIRIRNDFDEADRQTFDDLIEDVRTGKRTAASVSRILARTGTNYSGNNISRHVRGECGCKPGQ